MSSNQITQFPRIKRNQTRRPTSLQAALPLAFPPNGLLLFLTTLMRNNTIIPLSRSVLCTPVRLILRPYSCLARFRMINSFVDGILWVPCAGKQVIYDILVLDLFQIVQEWSGVRSYASSWIYNIITVRIVSTTSVRRRRIETVQRRREGNKQQRKAQSQTATPQPLAA